MEEGDARSSATTHGKWDAERAEPFDDLPTGMCRTENGAPCLESTGTACVDFFYKAVPGIKDNNFYMMLENAWNENKETALKLIFQAGNCRRREGGKLDQHAFIRGLIFLFHRDVETLLCNLREVVRQGCYKTLLDLVMYLLHQGAMEENLKATDARKKHQIAIRVSKVLKSERRRHRESRQAKIKMEFAREEGVDIETIWMPASGSILGRRAMAFAGTGSTPTRSRSVDSKKRASPLQTRRRSGSLGNEAAKVSDEACKPVKIKRRANCGRWVSEDVGRRFKAFLARREACIRASDREAKKARIAAASSLVSTMDQKVSRVYDAVARIFADDLAAESAAMHEGKKSVGGLCAKWAPSSFHMHDKKTMMVDAIIARLPPGTLHTKGSTPRIRYNQMCAEIRRAANIPEALGGRGEWKLINYNRMPSVCRNVWGKRVFEKHDPEGYRKFLEDAKEALLSRKKGLKARVHTGALLPHNVTEGAAELADADLQWHGLVTRTMEARTRGGDGAVLVPVCDVSGSMSGIPMEVGIALSMLLAESAPAGCPLRHKMFTFERYPKLLTLPDVPDHAAGVVVDGSLASRVAWVRNMDWGGNTDFEAVCNLLLKLALENRMTDETVEKLTVCVFSDMQFDEARGSSSTPWSTTHETITESWRQAGYTSCPRMVYWNLRDSKEGTPAARDCPGVALLSGFSSCLLEVFLECKIDNLTPESQLAAVLGKDCYERLRIA